MKRRALAVILGFAVLWTAGAEVFRFSYAVGDRYRIISRVYEDVYINGIHSHRADILNKIAIEVTGVRGGSGLIEATFQTSERAYGSGSVYEWGEEYESVFWRSEHGAYDIAPHYFMPVVRDVPLFPDRDLSPGDTWSATGNEVHDFRANFGVPNAYHFPIHVSYTYLGVGEKDGGEYHFIAINYAVFHRARPVAGARVYPVRISGESSQVLYWDSTVGQPYAYEEEFDFVFELSSGDTVEYVGYAEAKVVEARPMDRQEMADAIRRKLEAAAVPDAEVSVADEGVTVRLENIQFYPDSPVMLPGEETKLRVIADILAEYPGRDVLVTGHTALAGTEEGRQRLSEERARVVGNYLLQAGVRAEDEITTRGMGARQPIADNRTEEGMRRNRRVEITILEN